MKNEKMDSAMLQADGAQMRQFLDTIFKRCEGVTGWIALRAFEHEREGRAVANQWVPFGPETLMAAVTAATQVANRTGERRAVFSPPVAIFGEGLNKDNARFAGEANVVCAPAIAVELDKEPQESLARLVKVLGEPTLTIASGGVWNGEPKLHAYWRLGEPAMTENAKAALKTARKMATKLVDGDGTAVALSHPMRWPGSWHTKNEPTLCRVVGGDPNRDIRLQWAVEALDEALMAAGLEIDGRGTLARAERKGFKTDREWSTEDLMAAAAAIPNDEGTDWEAWNKTGMAFYDASHGSPEGLEAFILYSEKNAKGDAGDAERRWKHYASSPPEDLSGGTLIMQARATDPDFRTDRINPADWFEDEKAPLDWPVELNSFQDTPAISLTPLRQFDPKTLPRRQWLYGNHYIRKYVSATAAPSAVGKSSMTMVEALAMATGKPLLGVQPKGTYRVWIWNGEDPIEELELRIAAAMHHYGLTWADLGDRVFLDSGRVMPVVLATAGKQGAQIAVPVVEGVIAGMKANAIDVAIMDPFVSTFSGPETNEMFEPIVKKWGFIAGATNASVELVHHTRKLNGAETGVEDMRGGGALVAGARAKRVLARMSASEAKKFGVREDDHRRFFRVADASVNMALPAVSGTTWFEMKGVPVGNGDGEGPLADMTGDQVGVATLRTFAAVANEMDETTVERIKAALSVGEWRENFRSNAWAGFAVADVVGLDPKEDRAEIEQTLREMKGMNALRVERRLDKNNNIVPFIVVVGPDNSSEQTDKKSETAFD